MLARVLLTAAVMIATVRGVSGQMGTADGVAALARGDYRRAVEILRPIAEDWRSNDTAAQFFMAGLYETGRGVPADPLRACALYARAISKRENPFGQQAFAFYVVLARDREFEQECQHLANLGFDHGFEPATFDFGPGHTVEWTLSAVTITYEGRTRRERMGFPFAPPGARFLPLHHTELATGPTRSVTRHFIELFFWQPSGQSDGWSLQWRLFEVVRNEIIWIDTPDSLVTLQGDAPPPNTFDVRDYAVLRVDDDGHSELAVLKGPRSLTQRIASDAERREVREAERARDAAMARVDWSERYEVHREPAMTYVDADGCGQVHIYGWTADRAEAIHLRAMVPAPGRSAHAATFDLSRDAANVSLEAHIYEAPQRRFAFCSHVITPPNPNSIGPEVWRAVTGTVSIELSPPGIRAHIPSARRATVTLSNIVLRNATGATVTMSRPVRLSAIVGFMQR